MICRSVSHQSRAMSAAMLNKPILFHPLSSSPCFPCLSGSKMKLELSLVVHGCWVGVLTGLGRTALPGGVCCMYTRCCTMPQLTHDTLHTLNNLPSVIQLTLDTLCKPITLSHTTLSLFLNPLAREYLIDLLFVSCF